MVTFVLSLVLSFSSAFATGFGCGDLLSGGDASVRQSQRHFLTAVEQVRARGGENLLRPFDNDSATIVFKRRWPLQSAVSGRQNWRARPTVTVRELGWTDEKSKQVAVWQTAVAFFELETRHAMWSNSSMGLGSTPGEWRAEKLKRISLLENELYLVFQSLDLLTEDDVLPESDPGHFWMMRTLVGDSSKSIGPNKADFEAWKAGLSEKPSDSSRSRKLIVNYWANYIRRALTVLTVIQLAVMAPDAHALLNQEWSTAGDRPAATLSIEDIDKSVKQEEARRVRQIERERAKPTPNAEFIRELQESLAQFRKEQGLR